MNIHDSTAIVTGGASGLGAATATALARAGAKVAIFDLHEEAGAATATAIGGTFQRTDVTDEASVIASLAAAEADRGPARILVNCAGIAPAIRIVDKHGVPHPSPPIAARSRSTSSAPSA